MLDDQAATPIANGVAPFTGSYRPESPLSVFNNLGSSGNWTLKVVDGASGDVGIIQNWTLTLTLLVTPETCAELCQVNCNDNVGCTIDSCDPASGCVHTPNNATCLDGNSCTSDVCDPGQGCIHPALGDGTACDDGNPCTHSETCLSGVCGSGIPKDCDDGNACTSDSCDLADGGCLHAAITCDDHDPCTDNNCEPGAGCLYPPTVCDDQNPCTDDSCVPGTGCVFTPDDTNSCPGGSGCAVPICISGVCQCSSCAGGTTVTAYDSTDTPRDILDGSVVSSTLTVSGALPFLKELKARTFIQHSSNGDLWMTLRSPAGTVVTLTSDNGGASDNVFNGTIWSDNADPGNQVPFPEGPFPGSSLVTDHVYANNVTATPLTPEEPLGAFWGENPNGAWTLSVYDHVAGNTGVLSGWGIAFSTLADQPVLTTNTIAATRPGTVIQYYETGVAERSLTVPQIAGTVARVKLQMNFGWSDPGDWLDVTLTSPSGTVVTIGSDSAPSWYEPYRFGLFDDFADPGNQVPFAGSAFSASSLITDHDWYAGGISPPQAVVPEEPLSAFRGENPSGDWTLRVSADTGSTDWSSGYINAFSVEITTMEWPGDCGVDCDDGNPCTNDCCAAGSGQCTHAPVACDDNDPCTTDTCSDYSGCVHTSVCDDHNPCTTDTCESGGGCSHTPLPGAPCDDHNPCTSDACDASGQCLGAPLPQGLSCADGNACTTGDLCDGAGLCVGGAAPNCDDGNVETSDRCDPTVGCTHTLMRFVDVTPTSMRASRYGRGIAWGDYDGDGRPDLFITSTWGSTSHLLHNDGYGGFTDVTPAVMSNIGDGLSASWGDIDNDGKLDLVVTANGDPPNHLFHNDGGGAFTDLPIALLTPGYTSNSGLWGDYDSDGSVDVFITRGYAPNLLMRNLGSGSYASATPPALASPGGLAAWGDCDGDWDLDLFLSGRLFRNDGNGQFADITPSAFQATTGLDFQGVGWVTTTTTEGSTSRSPSMTTRSCSSTTTGTVRSATSRGRSPRADEPRQGDRVGRLR